jgi:GMP synthase-like glutamine amidotransferase
MLLVIQHSESGPLGLIRPLLAEYAMGVRTVGLHRHEAIPDDLDDIDGIISLGGPQSANDRSPLLEREIALLQSAHAQSLPILGVCLGSQLLAKALGGEVGRLPVAEIGWRDVALSAIGREDPLFTGIGWRTAQFHWHSEQVTTLPKEARLLGSSSACPVQAWGAGLRSYGLQYHPEVEEATIHRWLREDASQLGPAGVSADAVLSATVENLATMARLTERLIANWALFVAPFDRRYHGVPSNRASAGV